MKPVAIFDTECFINYWLAKFLNPATGKTVDFELHADCELNKDFLREVLKRYTLISFNGIDYDLPIIYYALSGATNEELKLATNDLIGNKLRSWQFEQKYGIEIPKDLDHIDLIEVAPGVMDSLKIYGGRLHTKKMQDLPYPIDAIILPEHRPVVSTYCGNDLQCTLELYNALAPALKVRERLTAKHGIDLRSKSDPQIAETIIVSELEKLNDAPVKRPPKGNPAPFKYDTPSWVSFKTEKLNTLLRQIQGSTFSIVASEAGKESLGGLDEAAKVPINIRGRTYQFGIGGLHSQESNTSWRATKKAQLYEIDATSFYPSGILNNGWYPPQLGEGFLTIFGKIVAARITAKEALKEVQKQLAGKLSKSQRSELEQLKEDLTEEAEGGKIMINGTFGKGGSKFSYLCSHKMMIQVTLTGQLAELMLIEALELSDISVVSANTDGIVVYCLAEQREAMLTIIEEWENVTAFNMEESEYIGLFSRDVNNYLAFKTDGKIKGKGIFADTSLKHSPNNQVCYAAVVAYLKHGTPIEDTVSQCKDIREFVVVRSVNDGAAKDGEPIGKHIRYYHSTLTDTPITVQTNGNKVPDTDGAMPCMELPDEFPSDVDLEWYIDKAKGILYTPDYLNTPKRESGIGLTTSEIYALTKGDKVKPLLKIKTK